MGAPCGYIRTIISRGLMEVSKCRALHGIASCVDYCIVLSLQATPLTTGKNHAWGCGTFTETTCVVWALLEVQ